MSVFSLTCRNTSTGWLICLLENSRFSEQMIYSLKQLLASFYVQILKAILIGFLVSVLIRVLSSVLIRFFHRLLTSVCSISLLMQMQHPTYWNIETNSQMFYLIVLYINSRVLKCFLSFSNKNVRSKIHFIKCSLKNVQYSLYRNVHVKCSKTALKIACRIYYRIPYLLVYQSCTVRLVWVNRLHFFKSPESICFTLPKKSLWLQEIRI